MSTRKLPHLTHVAAYGPGMAGPSKAHASKAAQSLTRGVPFSQLASLINSLGGRNAIAHKSTSDIITALAKTPLPTPNPTTRATLMVSHAWSDNFLTLVDSLENYLLDQELDYETPIWIDFLCLPPAQTVRSHDWWSSVFIDAVVGIGAVVLVMQKWEDSIALRRIWILYEMYACHCAGASFKVALPPDEKAGFLNALMKDPSYFHDLLTTSVNAEKALATKRSDKSAIQETILKSCGFFKLVSIIRDRLFGAWIVAECRQRVARSKDELEYCNWKAALSQWYHLQKEYSLAEPVLLESMKLRKRLMGSFPPATLNLALLYKSQLRFDEALPLFAEYLTVCRESLGNEHPDAIAATAHLANLHFARESWDQSESLYTQCYHMSTKTNGEMHPTTLLHLLRLAQVYEAMGTRSAKKAESLFIQCLAARRLTLGPTHPDTLESIHILARFYLTLNRHSESETLCLECLQARRTLFGENHIQTLEAKNSLAEVYYAQERFQLAEPLYMQYAAHLKQNLEVERDAMSLLQPLSNLALCCTRIGLYEKAEMNYLEVVDLSKKVWGADDVQTLIYMMGLAEVCKLRGNYEKARQLLVQCVDVGERELGEQDAYYQLFVKSLADC
ncbi:hypothetical protein CcCBS67573_g01707 [Chytriomyces confervae]|uniref:MalT-like TPR region domain-containing protein n=1 Tax=Chytriomyces confervae TaxID=246404 RepID=A0A507FNI7_9FUNG|nr:hypothetical protein CcCBS67573_g01707 [Chytriomyces confervae]